MRPVTLNLGGIQDPQVSAALQEIQRASQDTLQNDTSSSGAAISTLVGATLGSNGPEIPYFIDQYHVQYLSLAIPPGSGSLRFVLGGPTTFYVATNGSDANSGLTSGTPWLTLAHAMAVITQKYDFGGQTVTLQAVAGHAIFSGQQLPVTPWVGGGSFIYDGGGGSISFTGVTQIDGTIAVKQGALPGPFTIQNVTITSSAGAAINMASLLVASASIVIIGSGVTFGSGSFLAYVAAGGFIQLLNNFSVSGGGNSLLFASGGLISTNGVPISVNFTSSVAYSTATVWVQGAGLIFIGTVSFLNGGNVGGATSRYLAATAGTIITGGGQNFIPGANPGTATPPGSYQ